MIQLFLFGEFSGSSVIAYANTKFLKTQDLARFDPLMIFNLAKSLYQIGNELKGGELKELDLKAYCLITKLAENQLLIIGVDKSDRNLKKIRQIKELMGDIHESCVKSIDYKVKYKWTMSTQLEFLRDRFSKNSLLNKELKSMVKFGGN